MWPYNFPNYRSKCLARLIYSLMQSLRRLIKTRRYLFLIFLLGFGQGGALWGTGDNHGHESVRGGREPGVTITYSSGTFKKVTVFLSLFSFSLLRWALFKTHAHAHQGICSRCKGFYDICYEGIKILLKYLYI